MQKGAQTTRIHARHPVVWPRDHDKREGQKERKRVVVHAPSQIASSEDDHRPVLCEVGSRHVAVRDVAVRAQAVIDEEVHIVHDGGIPDDRPVKGEDNVVREGCKQRRSNQKAERRCGAVEER